jgi:tRNA 2-selenouridine synthase
MLPCAMLYCCLQYLFIFTSRMPDIEKLEITEFLAQATSLPVIDVRSPAEYAHAHIPGAHNLPLFSNEERAVVGTLYKQKSREAAIKAGLDYFGPKMRAMVEAAEALTQHQTQRGVLVHCWRGGMRSGAVAWLLNLYGFKVCTLAGGYKQFRRWVLAGFETTQSFRVLGGYTGSGKTHLLHRLQQQGQPVLDLEALAGHKGSAFGAIGLPPQTSQEHFENRLALAIAALPAHNPAWVEDESQRIGLVNLPIVLWNHLRTQPVCFLEIGFEERLQHIIEEYGGLDRERMKNAIERIQKRLGPLETKMALAFLAEGDIAACFRILLTYYDKWYLKGLQNRENLEGLLQKIACEKVDAEANAKVLIQELRLLNEA